MSRGTAPAPPATGDTRRLVCHSPAMRELLSLVKAVAGSECGILITGETGAGKEEVARAIHAHSPRRRGRFVAINCAAIPPTLLERELFGHERGAFTGADQRRKGALEAASGGTFLLDEIGELDPRLQAKLLRVLQHKEIIRLGSTEPIPVNVRFIATTNRDLAAAVQQGTFRPDLYYRLNTVEVHVPPLRERRDDILPLCYEFLAAASDGRGPRELSARAATLLLNYHWPGNVRELQSAIERACLLCDGPRIEPQHLPPQVQGAANAPAGAGSRHPSTAPEPGLGPDPSLADYRQARRLFERNYFIQALAIARGNISAAARHAGISWKHFRHKMRELNIRPDAWRVLADNS